MEAYEKKLIDRTFLDGIDLTWGNADAVLELVRKIALREGWQVRCYCQRRECVLKYRLRLLGGRLPPAGEIESVQSQGGKSMQMNESPEVWTPPELIVLVRSKPEEAVLTVCKIWESGGPASSVHCSWGSTACLDVGSS
jgi:hypothetical protein